LRKTDGMPETKPASTMESLPPPPRRFDWGRRIGPRAALVAGFTVLLVIMAVLALDSMRALREIEATSAQIRHEDLVRERALRKIRSTVHQSGNLFHEYSLSDPRPDARESYPAQLNDMREHVNVRVLRPTTKAQTIVSLPLSQSPILVIVSSLLSTPRSATQRLTTSQLLDLVCVCRC
jgi:hypothetical protein